MPVIEALRIHFNHKRSDQPWRYSERAAPTTFNVQAFIQMLAKIAHGYAVGEVGLNNFAPLLPNIILWRDPMLANFLVGSASPEFAAQIPLGERPEPGAKNPMYDGIQLRILAQSIGSRVRITVFIRLFPVYHQMLYEIIAGELLPGTALYARLVPVPISPNASTTTRKPQE